MHWYKTRVSTRVIIEFDTLAAAKRFVITLQETRELDWRIEEITRVWQTMIDGTMARLAAA